MVVLLDIDRLIATDMAQFSGNLTQGETSPAPAGGSLADRSVAAA
jgi:hypothetical protein